MKTGLVNTTTTAVHTVCRLAMGFPCCKYLAFNQTFPSENILNSSKHIKNNNILHITSPIYIFEPAVI